MDCPQCGKSLPHGWVKCSDCDITADNLFKVPVQEKEIPPIVINPSPPRDTIPSPPPLPYLPFNRKDEERTFVQPVTGQEVTVGAGFSWGCLLLGPLWYLWKRMRMWTFYSFVLSLLTCGLSSLFLAFFAHRHHRSDLINKGYILKSQLTGAALLVPAVGKDNAFSQVVTLKSLLDTGAITQEDYEAQLKKIIAAHQ